MDLNGQVDVGKVALAFAKTAKLLNKYIWDLFPPDVSKDFVNRTLSFPI